SAAGQSRPNLPPNRPAGRRSSASHNSLHVNFPALTINRLGAALARGSRKFPKERIAMSEKVVLPKFDLPSERMHPAIKAVAIVGSVLVLSLAILGLGIYQRHKAQLAAEQRRDAIIAQRIAEANAVVEAAKARAAEAA